MKYFVYFLWNQEQYFLNITHRPVLDLAFQGGPVKNKMALLTGPLSIGFASYLLEQIATPQEISGQKWRRTKNPIGGKFYSFVAALLGESKKEYPKVLKEKFAQVKKAIASTVQGGKTLFPEAAVLDKPDFVQPNLYQEAGDIDDWRPALQILAGRLLLPREVGQALKEHNIILPMEQEDLLQLLYLEGLVKLLPAVGLDQGAQPLCRRCGERAGIREIECLDCGDRCFYCEECLNMGEARFCLPLYAFHQVTGGSLIPDPLSRTIHGGLHLDFQLTPAQADASGEAKNFVTGSREEVLIWAVCGAGKTEVAFAAIDEVLQRGGKVLFAIPRRDVVIELEPRLRKAFPQEKIACLYGGSSGKFQQANVIIATTHQVIRFYQAFDLVVLDEVDAFPYAGSTMLYNALQRAKKPEGKLACMTATPSQEILQKVEKGEAALIRIPARHHGYPLPEPVVSLEQGISYKGGRVCIPQTVYDFLKKNTREQGAQVFVFVPNINLAPLVAREIARGLEGHGNGVVEGVKDDMTQGGLGKNIMLLKEGISLVHWSHAKDPERDSKREAFSKGQIKIFVTTTIMERGITVPHAHVLVLFADQERIFDQGTLVQMAGRAGRSTAFPQGNVCFIGSRKTKSMVSACRAIREMNLEAAKRGYLIEKYCKKFASI